MAYRNLLEADLKVHEIFIFYKLIVFNLICYFMNATFISIFHCIRSVKAEIFVGDSEADLPSPLGWKDKV